ncbi:MAG: YhjD/YihY/BrkB family envelope integrity protein [Phycisphaerales bacterium]|jgi:membrane protein|nr:YhjD/YihY/BrkB family envelope integrity protein [Phycisphaerales bacterium]
MRIKTIVNRVRSAITDPLEELSRWDRFIRYVWHLLKEGASQLKEDRASTMAASLTYRTLFGVLPMTVVGAGVARAIMGESRFKEFLHNAITASGLNQIQITSAADGEVATLGSWLSDLVSSGMNINVAALTWIGVLVLIYSALALMVNIETSFNVICRAKKGRSWLRRIPVYWFVLTFGPVAAAVALWADQEVASVMKEVVGWAWLLLVAQQIWSFALSWAVLLLLYRTIPTAKVQATPAMIGALVAAIFLSIGHATLSLYFSHAISLRQLYGSLGLVPIFMFWLYLMWLIVLLGLQVAAIFESVSEK